MVSVIFAGPSHAFGLNDVRDALDEHAGDYVPHQADAMGQHPFPPERITDTNDSHPNHISKHSRESANKSDIFMFHFALGGIISYLPFHR